MGNTDVKVAVSVFPSFGLLTVYPTPLLNCYRQPRRGES